MLDDDELAGARVRQWPQQHGFDDGEERGVGADTECEREDGSGRKAGLEPEQPERATNILSEHDEYFPSWAASAAGMNEGDEPLDGRQPQAFDEDREHTSGEPAVGRREAQIGKRRAVEIALGAGRQPSTEPFGPT